MNRRAAMGIPELFGDCGRHIRAGRGGKARRVGRRDALRTPRRPSASSRLRFSPLLLPACPSSTEMVMPGSSFGVGPWVGAQQEVVTSWSPTRAPRARPRTPEWSEFGDLGFEPLRPRFAARPLNRSSASRRSPRIGKAVQRSPATAASGPFGPARSLRHVRRREAA